MASLPVREEGRTQLTVVTITRNWPSLKIQAVLYNIHPEKIKRSNHKLLNSRPSWIRSRAARLEPVLALPVIS